MNDWPLVADRPDIEKTRPFCLQISEAEKAAHHAGLVGCFFAQLSYSLRIARLASSLFMLATQTLADNNSYCHRRAIRDAVRLAKLVDEVIE